MPSMDDIYGGNSLKAEEVPVNFQAVVTVENVTLESMKARDGEGPSKKLALHFVGKDKGLLLNVTNANMMAEITGTKDYDYWTGHQVLLYRTTVDFAGKRVPAIRIDHPANLRRPVPPPAVRPVAPPPPPPPVQHGEPGLDEIDPADVPFSLTALLPVLLPLLALGRMVA